MQQYFIKGQVENPVIIKDKDTVKHMFNVMRLTEDDQVVLVFEDGVKRLARVIDRENHVFEVIEDLNETVEMPVSVTIASGFPKGDKLELVTQKVTELGAQAIWGFPADWSVVKWDGKKLAKKEDKLARIALGAAEQSKRNCVPEVRLFEKKGEFLSELAHFDKIFIAYEETAKAGELATLLVSWLRWKMDRSSSLSLDQKEVFLRLRLMHLKKLVALKLALDRVLCGRKQLPSML